MEVCNLLRSLLLVLLLILTVVGNMCIMARTRASGHSEIHLKRVIHILVISGMTSTVISLTNMLISVVSGGWPFGGTACQAVACCGTVASAMTAWMMALAALERYFKILQHSAYPFTFTAHNMKVLVMGLGMLVVIIAVGPIYGFGEYSCLIGYFEVVTKANSTKLIEDKTTPNLSTSCTRAQVTQTNQPALRDPISALHEAMTSGYGVQIGRIFASTDNIRFYFQVENETLLENLRIDYMNGRFAEFMFGVFDKIPTPLSGYNVNIILDEESFNLYRRLFLPIQELGLCSVNMFSPNLHSDVWIIFHVFVSFLIPYGLLLTCYAILYLRTPMTVHNFRPNSRDEWDCTNVFCMSGVTACLMSLLYFSVLLAAANRAYVTPSMMFFAMCCYYASGTTLFVAFVLNAFYYKAKTRCTLFRNRWRKESNSIEMSEV